MNYRRQIAKQSRDLYFGGNWTVSDLRQHLSDVNIEEALAKVHCLNTIATLTFHIHYFINVAVKYLKREKQDANDNHSFKHPPFETHHDWKQFVALVLSEGEQLARLIEEIPDERLNEVFMKETYGNYFRNLLGLIEHSHYHLGQIILIKKLLRAGVRTHWEGLTILYDK
jgi:hypothetical protein